MPFLEKLAPRLDIPADVVTSLPRIEMWGQNSVSINGHTGILEYQPEHIKIGTKKMNIDIHGFDLELSLLSRDEVAIRGTILSLSVERV